MSVYCAIMLILHSEIDKLFCPVSDFQIHIYLYMLAKCHSIAPGCPVHSHSEWQ